MSGQVIYFATRNADKFMEASKILYGLDIRQVALDLPEFQGEMGDVALMKARMAFEKIKKPVFVDDTSLAFAALNGMPGIYIKHFLKAIGHDGLNNLLAAYQDKSAVAYASIGYCDEKEATVFIGECRGKIVHKREGKYGFQKGWDQIFQPEGYEDTFSTMSSELKNMISHRRKALLKLREYLTR